MLDGAARGRRKREARAGRHVGQDFSAGVPFPCALFRPSSRRRRDRMNNLSAFAGFVGPRAEDAPAPLDSCGRRCSAGRVCLASTCCSSSSTTAGRRSGRAAHLNYAGWGWGCRSRLDASKTMRCRGVAARQVWGCSYRSGPAGWLCLPVVVFGVPGGLLICTVVSRLDRLLGCSIDDKSARPNFPKIFQEVYVTCTHEYLGY
jgi:hypothetical protein